MEEKKKSSGLAISGLVLGILAIVFAFIPFVNFISYILGGLAFIFGIITVIRDAEKIMPVIVIILSIISCSLATNMNKKAVGFIANTLNSTDPSTNTTLSDALSNSIKELDKVIGNATEEILKNDVQVSMGSFEVKDSGYGLYDTKMEVTVTNKLSENKSYSIHIEAVNKSGERIADDYIYATGLGAGQSQKFKAFTYVESDKINDMKEAQFRIVKATAY